MVQPERLSIGSHPNSIILSHKKMKITKGKLLGLLLASAATAFAVEEGRWVSNNGNVFIVGDDGVGDYSWSYDGTGNGTGDASTAQQAEDIVLNNGETWKKE